MKKKLVALFIAVSFSVFSVAQDGIDTVITNVVNVVMLQAALTDAANNQKLDIISIPGGVLDISNLSGPLWYFAESRPKNIPEENMPLWIIGAGMGKSIIDGGNKNSILDIYTYDLHKDMAANITIQGITFRNSKPGSVGHALAIGTGKANIRIINCEFINCHGNNGGTISAFAGDAEAPGNISIVNCIFTDNHAGIETSSNALTLIEECTFRNTKDNPAIKAASKNGAFAILDCVFENNNSAVSGFLSEGGSIEITGCTFTGNYGAVDVEGIESTFKIHGNSFENNSALEGGALRASIVYSGNFSLRNNSFRNNHSTNDGGAAYIYSSSVELLKRYDVNAKISIVNNIFESNSTSVEGGGLRMETHMGAIELINNTFAFNKTRQCDEGAALSIFLSDNSATAALYNNIFWGNRCNTSPGIDLFVDTDWQAKHTSTVPDGIGAGVELSHNIYCKDNITVPTSVKRSSNLNSNPLFGDSLRLSSESPAIDAGINDAWGPIGQKSNKDYEGNERIQDGDGNGSDIIDMGAIEFRKVHQ